MENRVKGSIAVPGAPAAAPALALALAGRSRGRAAGGIPGSGHGGWLDTWHVDSSLNKNFEVIDGLRGVAILLVVGCHLVYAGSGSGWAASFVVGVFGAGAYGVPIFFTLSGFLIAHPFWKRKFREQGEWAPPGYGWRRFWKIYPPLALSVVVLTPVYILTSHDWSYLDVAGRWLMGISVVVPATGRFNPALWSIVVETQFYLVLPLVFWAVRYLASSVCLWVVPIGFLVVPMAARGLLYHWLSYTIHPEINVRFPSCLDAFALGILVAGLENRGLVRKEWARLGDAGLALLVVALPTSAWLNLEPAASERMRSEIVVWMFRAASALLLCYIADPEHPRARWFSQPWLRWCGLISYEWYLFHQPIILWMRVGLGPAEGHAARYALILGSGLAVGLVLAAVVYRFFSLPILRFGRSRAGGRRPEARDRKEDVI